MLTRKPSTREKSVRLVHQAAWFAAVFAVLLFAHPAARGAGGLDVWAVGEGVRINPLSGKAFEENAKQLPGGISGDYRSKNWVWDGASRTVSLKGAANEVLAFQLILEGPGVTGINVTAANLQGPGGALIPAKQFTFFRAFYIHKEKGKKGGKFSLAPGWFPDPLVPLSTPKIGAPFAMDGSNFGGQKPDGIKNQTVWADLWIPKHTPKGNYKGKISVNSSAGKISLNVNVEVFAFEMPDEEHLTFEITSYKELQKLSVREQIYIRAHQHRATILMDSYHISDYYEPRLTAKNGKFNWEGFDNFYGPGIDGSLYKNGPRAGVPEPYFNLPFGPAITRPDKRQKYRAAIAWPILNPTKNNKLEVDFTPAYTRELHSLLKDASGHFAEKYPKTTIVTLHVGLDEPGFQTGWAHRTKKTALAILHSIQGYTKIIKSLKVKNLLFKLDIGSGFCHNGFDLDGDGTMEGPRDIVDALPDVGLWCINGNRIRLDPVAPLIKKGTPVWFYNSGRRVGRTDIAHEGLAARTWAWVAWNSKLAGISKYDCLVGYFKKPWVKGGGAYLFFYPGAGVGVPGKVFVSMRLKAFRRGLQDYEYLYLLAKKDGKKDRANALALKVVQNAISRKVGSPLDDRENDNKDLINSKEKDLRHWSHDPGAFEKVRREIGGILSN